MADTGKNLDEQKRAGRRALLVLFILCLIGMGLRAAPIRGTVFPGNGKVRFLNLDAYTHLRQTAYAVEHFPAQMVKDPLDRFPAIIEGSGGFFEAFLAGIGLLVGLGRPGPTVLAQVCAWMPVFLTGISLVLMAAIARQAISWPMALWVSAAVVLQPGDALYPGVLGYVDRRLFGAVVVLALALLAVQRKNRATLALPVIALVLVGPLTHPIADPARANVDFLSAFAAVGILAVAAIPLGFRRARHHGLVAATLLALAIACHKSPDHSHMAIYPLALLAAYALDCLLPKAKPGPFDTQLVIFQGLLFVLLVVPAAWGWSPVPWVSNEVAANATPVDEGWEQTLDWVRSATPEPVASGSPARLPYGILTSWERGPLVTALAGRPVVFGHAPGADVGKWFVTEDEASANSLLCPDCVAGQRVRYVILDARSVAQRFMDWVTLSGRSLDTYASTSGSVTVGDKQLAPATYGVPFSKAVSVRLYHQDGLDLAHYRLVYESPHRSRVFYLHNGKELYRASEPVGTPEKPAWNEKERPPLDGEMTPQGVRYNIAVVPTVKVFEVVPGARMEGTAPPGAVVAAELSLAVVASGRKFAHVARVVAGNDGKFALEVPYPTENTPASAVRALGPYKIQFALAGRAPLDGTWVLTEQQIRTGAVVKVPPVVVNAGGAPSQAPADVLGAKYGLDPATVRILAPVCAVPGGGPRPAPSSAPSPSPGPSPSPSPAPARP